jgi:Fe-S-cluster containining protein
MRRSEIDARLDALYAQLPALDCTGDCWVSCGPIDMTWREQARIREHGVKIPRADPLASIEAALAGRDAEFCPALTRQHRCAVYDVRPLICRLWGLTESMRCPFGCQPRPRRLTDAEANALLTESMAIGGHEVTGTRSFDEIMQAAQIIGARGAPGRGPLRTGIPGALRQVARKERPT